MTKAVKQKKWYRKVWVIALLFLLGFAIAAYPIVSQLYYRVEANQSITDFEKEVESLSVAEIDERMALAHGYNANLKPFVFKDPFSDLKEEGLAEYARMLEVQEKIGYVEIPRISQNIPIYAGTSETVLQKGVGHLEGSSLPVGGDSTHTVLTAHRGLPRARLFTDLDELEEGDIFYVHNIKEVLAYKVDQILVVEPSNFEPVLVVEGKDYATLLTCTPYMINSHRLLVRGERIPYTAPVEEHPLQVPLVDSSYGRYLLIAIGILLLLLLIYLRMLYRMRKVRKRLEEKEKAMVEISAEDNIGASLSKEEMKEHPDPPQENT